MPDKPHILQIAPTPFFADRGCHIRIEGIVRCLTQLGYRNTVCTYHHGRDIDGVTTKRISPIKGYTQTEAGPSKYKLWADWKLLWLTIKHYRALKPVAIHAHLHEGLMIGLVIKLLFFWRQTPLIADMQGSLTGELESHGSFKKYPFLRWPTKTLEQVLMWCANTIICSSPHSLNKIKNDFGITDNKISKGLKQLKELILMSKGTNVHFLIIGYPTENLAPYLSDNDLTRICTLTGQVPFESLPELLTLADIAIDPKFSDAGEGSGKMLNYLACGLPVLAFDTHNNRNYLPSDTLLASDIDDLQKNLLKLISDPETRASIARKNVHHFSKQYSWSITKEQLQQVYNKILTPTP